MTAKTRFLSLAAAIVSAFGALNAPAVAQTGNPYMVRDLAVDETGSTADEARRAGWAKAQAAGAQRLIDRLTLPEDRGQVDVAAVARMAGPTTVQETERSTATRYISVVAVTYTASSVREHLRTRNVPFVDSQAGLALLVPAASGINPSDWASLWSSKAADGSVTPRSDNTVLTPYVASARAFGQRPAWADVEQEASQARATRAVVAEAFGGPGQVSVRLWELRPGQPEVQIGQVGPFSSGVDARNGVIAEMENLWKRASIVRTSGSSDLALAAYFSDINQWVKMRRALEASRLITAMNVESISPQGADLRFTFSGREDQLQSDLRSRGLNLENGGQGWVLRAQ